jgi:hypothetical protein
MRGRSLMGYGRRHLAGVGLRMFTPWGGSMLPTASGAETPPTDFFVQSSQRALAGLKRRADSCGAVAVPGAGNKRRR